MPELPRGLGVLPVSGAGAGVGVGLKRGSKLKEEADLELLESACGGTGSPVSSLFTGMKNEDPEADGSVLVSFILDPLGSLPVGCAKPTEPQCAE